MFSNKRKKRSGAIKRIRAKFGRATKFEMLIFCSNRNVYAQIVNLTNGKTEFTVSTLKVNHADSGSEKKDKGCKNCRNVNVARELGVKVAEKCKAEGIDNVSFNRAGKIFHGVGKAVADGFYESLK